VAWSDEARLKSIEVRRRRKRLRLLVVKSLRVALDRAAAARQKGLKYLPSAEAIQEATKKRDELMGDVAYHHSISLGEVDKKLVKMMKSFTASDLVVFRGAEGSLSFLEGGRMMTQFETGRSAGLYDVNLRMEAEAKGIGIPEDVSVQERPVYGAFDTRGCGAGMYGPIKWVMKDGVKTRSTATYGDSLRAFASGNMVASPALDPSPLSVYLDQYVLEDLIDGKEPEGEYVEAQIQGGILLEDVKGVVFDQTTIMGGGKKGKGSREDQIKWFAMWEKLQHPVAGEQPEKPVFSSWAYQEVYDKARALGIPVSFKHRLV
jgi:hypothetical protein